MKKLFIVMGLIIGFSHQANAQTSKAIQWEPVESLPSEFSGVWATTGFKLSCDFSSGTPKSGINFLFQDVKNKVEYIFYYQPPGEGHNGVRHGGVRSFTPLRYSNFWRNKQNKNLFLIFYVPSNIYGAYYVGLDGVRKVDILKDGKPYDVFTQSKSNLEEVERWSVDQN